MVVRVRTFVITDTSCWVPESGEEAGGVGDEGVGSEGGVSGGGGSCLRKRAAFVNCVVVMTCVMVDVTVETWKCVAVAGPWVTHVGVNLERSKNGDEKRSGSQEQPLGRLGDGRWSIRRSYPPAMSVTGLGRPA